MNGRVAKRLRKEAEALTVGMPVRQYVNAGQGVRLLNCTREVYQALKAERKRR